MRPASVRLAGPSVAVEWTTASTPSTEQGTGTHRVVQIITIALGSD